MPDQPIFWISSSRGDLRNFPASARRKAGLELRALQRGESPTNIKPMPTVGSGTMEIRIHVGDAYRIFYVAKFKEGIYVLHAFQKKTRRTSKVDIELAQQRYQSMIGNRPWDQEGRDGSNSR